jgi:hypothetical protein
MASTRLASITSRADFPNSCRSLLLRNRCRGNRSTSHRRHKVGLGQRPGLCLCRDGETVKGEQSTRKTSQVVMIAGPMIIYPLHLTASHRHRVGRFPPHRRSAPAA